jgi:NitT/TauT family transport system permease protein
VDQNLINAARTLGAGSWYTAVHVIFPASLPGILDAFRVTVGWAWTYLVVAEMVAANIGIGYMVIRYQRYLKTDKIFAGVLMIGLIGLITDAVSA